MVTVMRPSQNGSSSMRSESGLKGMFFIGMLHWEPETGRKAKSVSKNKFLRRRRRARASLEVHERQPVLSRIRSKPLHHWCYGGRSMSLFTRSCRHKEFHLKAIKVTEFEKVRFSIRPIFIAIAAAAQQAYPDIALYLIVVCLLS